MPCDSRTCSDHLCSTGNDVHQPMREELRNTIFHYWSQWLCVLLITAAWILITFLPKLDDCPRGYVGPGGRHEHGQYENCTGGRVSADIKRSDLLFLLCDYLQVWPGMWIDWSSAVLICMTDQHAKRFTKRRSHTIPKVTEQLLGPFHSLICLGLLGILTGILLCYLGAQAGHSFAHSTRVRRVCGQWLVWGVICGAIALIVSKGGQSQSWIPINKNLWSLSFVLVLASLAFFIMTILYLLVDVSKVFTGEPWLWLGMNSIVLYAGHEICSQAFPVQFEVNDNHMDRLALNAYGVTFWMGIAGIMYFKKIFIAI